MLWVPRNLAVTGSSIGSKAQQALPVWPQYRRTPEPHSAADLNPLLAMYQQAFPKALCLVRRCPCPPGGPLFSIL